MVTPNICGPLLWNLLHVTLLITGTFVVTSGYLKNVYALDLNISQALITAIANYRRWRHTKSNLATSVHHQYFYFVFKLKRLNLERLSDFYAFLV
jgi:hypothetical protein